MSSSTPNVLIPHVSELCSMDETGIAHDFGLIFTELCERILMRARQSTRRNEKTFYIFNVCDQLQVQNRQTNIQYKTFFKGFWDPTSRKHVLEKFERSGIHRMMLEELQQAFGPRGYNITDVSDPAKSFNHVLMVTMHESES